MDHPTCPKCHLQILPVFYFCPNCGKILRLKPVTIGKQIGIYILSIFLPPLGLWPGFKYLFQKSGKAKIVGLVAIILTILSIVVTVYLTIGIMNQIKTQLNNQLNNGINSQLEQVIPQH